MDDQVLKFGETLIPIILVKPVLSDHAWAKKLSLGGLLIEANAWDMTKWSLNGGAWSLTADCRNLATDIQNSKTKLYTASLLRLPQSTYLRLCLSQLWFWR